MITIADIARIAARVFHADLGEMRGGTQDYHPTLARHVATVIACEMLPTTNKEVAAYFNHNPSSCCYARQRVEDEAGLNKVLAFSLQAVRDEVDLSIEQTRINQQLRHDMDIREALAAQVAEAHARYLRIVPTQMMRIESRATMKMRTAA